MNAESLTRKKANKVLRPLSRRRNNENTNDWTQGRIHSRAFTFLL